MKSMCRSLRSNGSCPSRKMSSMYALPLYFPHGTNATPLDVMYSQASYHGAESSNGTTPTASAVDFDPSVQLEKDQLALINVLKQLNERLDKHLASTKEAASPAKGSAKASPASTKGSAKATPDVTPSKPGKADKKAEKKAEKAEAKKENKKTAGDKPATSQAPKNGPTSVAWTVTEEKAPAERDNGITACAPPALAFFTQEPLTGNVTLAVSDADLKWVQALAKIAAHRSVGFYGAVENGCIAASPAVMVEKKDAFSLTLDGTTVSCRVTGMKLLGAALGLLSNEPTRAVQVTHVHRWLTRLDEIIAAGAVTKDLETLTREMSQFLSRFESLSTQPEFSLADVAIRPYLAAFKALPNNVEIWAVRFDKLN